MAGSRSSASRAALARRRARSSSGSCPSQSPTRRSTSVHFAIDPHLAVLTLVPALAGGAGAWRRNPVRPGQSVRQSDKRAPQPTRLRSPPRTDDPPLNLADGLHGGRNAPLESNARGNAQIVRASSPSWPPPRRRSRHVPQTLPYITRTVSPKSSLRNTDGTALTYGADSPFRHVATRGSSTTRR